MNALEEQNRRSLARARMTLGRSEAQADELARFFAAEVADDA